MHSTSSDQGQPGTTAAEQRSFWGRSARLGGGTGRLLTVSAALGLVGSAALAAGATALGRVADPSLPPTWNWLFPVVFMVLTAPVVTALAWVLLVDRTTIRGATPRPQDSIENRWYDRAAQATCHIMFPVIGLGAALASITRWQADTGLVLLALALLMLLVFGGSYLWAKRADS